MTMSRILIKFAFIILLSIPALAVDLPLSQNTKQPIEIDADSLEVLQKDKKAIFAGNVVAKQGTMVLTSNKMTVHYKPGGGDNAIRKIEVDGNVNLRNPKETAKGQRGVYDTENSVVTLEGDVVLTREQNILKGSKLIFNIATGQTQVIQGAGGRVRGLFVPQ